MKGIVGRRVIEHKLPVEGLCVLGRGFRLMDNSFVIVIVPTKCESKNVKATFRKTSHCNRLLKSKDRLSTVFIEGYQKQRLWRRILLEHSSCSRQVSNLK